MTGTLELAGFEPILKRVHTTLLKKPTTIGTAESCTGGMLSMLLTAMPGSSRYFLGGVAAYANAMKVDVLGIDKDLIDTFGAVSEQVGAAMAVAARRLTGADIGVGITGIAGPGGASEAKPVGTVWLGIAFNDSVRCRNLMLTGSRDEIRFNSAYAALSDVASILGNL